MERTPMKKSTPLPKPPFSRLSNWNSPQRKKAPLPPPPKTPFLRVFQIGTTPMKNGTLPSSTEIHVFFLDFQIEMNPNERRHHFIFSRLQNPLFSRLSNWNTPQWKKALLLPIPKPRFFTLSELDYSPMKDGTPPSSTEAPIFSRLPNWNVSQWKKAPLPLCRAPVFSRFPNWNTPQLGFHSDWIWSNPRAQENSQSTRIRSNPRLKQEFQSEWIRPKNNINAWYNLVHTLKKSNVFSDLDWFGLIWIDFEFIRIGSTDWKGLKIFQIHSN